MTEYTADVGQHAVECTYCYLIFKDKNDYENHSCLDSTIDSALVIDEDFCENNAFVDHSYNRLPVCPRVFEEVPASQNKVVECVGKDNKTQYCNEHHGTSRSFLTGKLLTSNTSAKVHNVEGNGLGSKKSGALYSQEAGTLSPHDAKPQFMTSSCLIPGIIDEPMAHVTSSSPCLQSASTNISAKSSRQENIKLALSVHGSNKYPESNLQICKTLPATVYYGDSVAKIHIYSRQELLEITTPNSCGSNVQDKNELKEVCNGAQNELDQSVFHEGEVENEVVIEEIECETESCNKETENQVDAPVTVKNEFQCIKCNLIFIDESIYNHHIKACFSVCLDNSLSEEMVVEDQVENPNAIVVLQSMFNCFDILRHNIENDHIYHSVDLDGESMLEKTRYISSNANSMSKDNNETIDSGINIMEDVESDIPDVIIDDNYCIDEQVIIIDSDTEEPVTKESEIDQSEDIKPDINELELNIKNKIEESHDQIEDSNNSSVENAINKGIENSTDIPDIKPDLNQLLRMGASQTNLFDEEEVKVLHCQSCESAFNDAKSYDVHLPLCRKNSDKCTYCKICRKAFINWKALNTHECSRKKEDIKYTCSICEKTFQNKDVAVTHMKTHAGKKDFVCEVCDKAFLLKHQLTSHVKTHNNDRPYKCQVCSKAFKRQSHLTKHGNSHKTDKERKYKCQYCEWAFFEKSKLRRHENSHVCTEKRLVCEICKCSFTEKQVLTQHMKIVHRGGTVNAARKMKSLLECEICKATFFLKRHFKNHMKSHKNEMSDDDDDGDDDYKDTESEETEVDDDRNSNKKQKLKSVEPTIKREKRNRKVKCKVCWNTFLAVNFQQHMKIQHGESEEDDSDD